MALDNDLSGIKEVKQTNKITDVGAVQNNQYSFEDVNFEVVNTELYKEAQQTRTTSLEDHIAGIPLVDTKIKISETKPDLTKTEYTSSFTTRDEIMSKLGMMDENFNYTDTYTNYINNGGAPLPGYEYAHQELLAQERYDSIFQKVEDGTMSYDTALMEAYGKDILATMGYDVTSVAYWRSKYNSMDFSNPFSNRYLMDQVKQAAENYHQSRLAGEYAHSNTKDTQLSSLVGKEIDESMSAAKIQDLFDMDEFKDNLEDKDFFRALHNGQIDASMRMTQDSDGTWYYLHTDGELYVLDGQKGENHGTLKTNGNGEFEGIDLNNSGLISFGRSTWTGFTGVFTGIADLGLMAANLVDSIIPVSALFGGDAGFWDGVDSDDFFEWSNAFDGWLQDDAAWLVDSGYIDLSSDISTQDVFNFTGSMIGTIAGTMALAGIIGGVGDAGTAASAASKGTGLMGWGQSLQASGHKVAGSIVKGTGTVLKWQTGNIGTNTGAYGKLVGKGSMSYWKNGANIQVWGRRFGAASVANTKNFANDYRKNALKANLYEDGASEMDILKASLVTMALNTGIDTFISGGMDDNQFQAWFGRDAGVFSNKAQLLKTNELRKLITNGTSQVMYDELEKNVKGSLKTYLLGRGSVIAFNSAADFAGNLLTGAIQTTSALDDKGRINGWKNFKEAFSPELVARSAVNTLWYSTRGQIKDWNAGLETIGRAHTDLMTRFQTEISESSGAKQKALIDVRNKYIEDIKTNKDATTYEGKILAAMDNLSEGLKKQGEEVPEILKTSLDKVSNEATRERLKQIYDNAEAIYMSKILRIEKLSNPGSDNLGFFKKMSKPFTSTAKWLSGVSGSDKATLQQTVKNTNFNDTIDSMYKTICSTEYTDYIEKADSVIKGTIKTDMLQSKTGYSLSKERQGLFEKLREQDPEAANKQYMFLPQEGTRDADYLANEVALDVSAELGYLKKIEVQGETVYEIQPYFDQIDYYNTAVVNSLIHKSVLALTAKTATKADRVEIIENLSKGLMDENVSDITKSSVIAKVLKTLSEPRQVGKDKDTKAFMSGRQAAEIMLELQSKGYISKIDIKKTKDVKGIDAYNYYITAGDMLLKLQKKKGMQIDLTDPIVQDVLSDWKKTGDITEEQYNALMKLQEENPESFQNGSLLNKQKFIENQIKKSFKDMLPKNKNLKDLDKGMQLYFKEIGHIEQTEDEFKETALYKDIVSFAEEYDKIYTKGKTINIDNGSVIYVDLEKFQGKTTTEFAKRILSIGYSSIKNIGNSKEYKEYESGLYNEMSNMNKYRKENGSLVKFDLAKDPETFRQFMKDFGYEISGNSVIDIKNEIGTVRGLTNFVGDTIVLNIPRVKNIDYIKDAIERGSVTVGNTSYNLKDLIFEDMKGNKLQKVDIDRAVLDQVEVKNIDPALQIILKQAPLLQVVPFEQPVDGKYNYTMPMSVALLGTEENLRKSSGKLAGQTGKNLTYLMKKSAGSKVAINKNLETYFTLNLIVEKMFSSNYNTMPVSETEVKYLKDNNLVDYVDKGKHKNKDTLWELSGTKKTEYKLSLKSSATKEAVLDYLVSPDFDVHKLLPFNFEEIDEQGRQGIIDAYATHTTSGTKELPKGLARETMLDMLNIRLPWDDGKNERYATFLEDLITSSANYNPLEGSGYTKHTEQSFATFDEWYEYAKTSTDPYDVLCKMYVDTYNDMVHTTNEDGGYDNHTLLIANPSARKALIKATQAGTIEATEDLVKQVQQYFITGEAPSYGAIQGVSSVAGTYIGKGEPVQNETYISESRVAASMGGYNNIEVKSDMEWVDIETVQRALDTVREIINTEDNIYKRSFYDNYIITSYKDNDVLKLYKGAAGSDGYIPIQDIDEYANILAENYRAFMDGRDKELILKESLVPALKDMWGSTYDKEVKAIFAEAKKHQRLATKQMEVLNKHIVSGTAPSLEKNAYSTFDYAPIRDEEGNLKPTEIGSNFGAMEYFLNNEVRNKDNDAHEAFDKLMSNSDGLLDGEFYDALQNRIMEDRNLYTSAPYTSDVDRYSYAHNAMGNMITTINTFNKLKETFKDGSDEDLMHLANTLVNLHSGTEYCGEKVNFIVVKNGSLKDGDVDLMDKYSSANLNDLLFNIHKAKQDLQGCTIIKANTQGIENVAGLKMEYKTITSNADFDDFVTDLYRNFIIDNSYYLTKDAKDIKDVEQLQQEIFGGSVNTANIQELLNKIPSERMSTLQRNKKVYDIYRSRADVAQISKGEFYSLMKAVDIIDANTLARDAVKQSIDFDEDYRSNKHGMSSLINLNFGLGSIDNMTPKRRELINSLKETISSEYVETKERDHIEQAIEFCIKNLVEREDAASIDYLMRDRSLIAMREDSKNPRNAFAINNDNGKVMKWEDANDFLNLAKSLESEDTTIETSVTRCISTDAETGLVHSQLDYDKSVFNLGIVVKTKTENGWEKKRYNIFVNYETDNMTEAQRTKFREAWIKENIEPQKNSAFYKDNKGFRDTVEQYRNIYDHISEDTLYLKPAEIKQFFSDLADPKGKTLLLGYNSSNADIPWFKVSGLIDDDILNKFTHVDVKVLGDTSQAIESKTSGKKDVRVDQYGLTNLAAHSGLYDADVTMDLFAKTVNTTYNISSIRNFIYRDIDKALRNSDIAKYLNEDQISKVYTEVDAKIKKAKESLPEINEYFDINKQITTDSVTAATDIFEYMLNKRMANMAYAIKDQQVIDNYLSAKAIGALKENKQVVVNKLWKFASDNGVSKESLINAIRIEMKHTGTDMNSLLETLGNESRVLRIVSNLGLDEEQFKEDIEGIKMFMSAPNKDKDLNSKMFEEYSTLKDGKNIIDTFHNIVHGLRFTNDADNQDFINELGTIYEFREGLNPNDIFKDEVKLINTKVSDMYKEYLYNNYGDVDAVMAQSKKGLYDLIDAVPVGKPIKDGISGKEISVDASMIVLSPSQFYNLTGKNYKEYEGELYSQLLIHPADANNKILPRRIVVDTDLKGNYMLVPETVIETLGSRDFDGDHLILLSPEDYSQDVLKIYTNEMYRVHNIQEATLDYLRQSGATYDGYKDTTYMYSTIGKDDKVIEYCREADKLLEQGKATDKLTQEFIEYVEENFPDAKIDKVLSSLWIVEKNLYEDTGDSTPIKYINNPATYSADGIREVTIDGKTLKVPVSFSGQERLKAEAAQLTNKYLYNFIDQTTGVAEKYAINKLKNITVKNPWTDLLASGIYGSNTVAKYFEGFNGSDESIRKGLLNTIEDSARNIYRKTKYEYLVDTVLKTYINKIGKDLEDGNNMAAFNKYDLLLRSIEEVQRKNMNPEDLMGALTSEPMIAKYEVMKDKIEATKKNIALYNELRRNEVYFPQDSNYGEAVDYNLNSLIKNLVKTQENSYNKNIFENTTSLTGFVITRFGESETPIGIGEDSILINNKANKDKRLVGYSRRIYKLNPKDKIEDIETGKFYKNGTYLTKGKNPIKLARRSYVVGKTKDAVTVIQVDYLDNGFKMATDFGGKGVVNGSYSAPEEYQIILNKPGLNKLPAGYSKPVDTTEIELELTNSKGKKIKCYGYKVEDIHPIVTEDTHVWDKVNDRNIDALHTVMDSQTINGILDMGATFEDGELKTNPEAYAELRNSVYKPYKDVQTRNFLGTYNRAKISYIINRLTDSELLAAFNTDMDPNELRYNLTNNIYLATEKYTSIAYTLGKKFANKIDDELGERLFNDHSLSLLGEYNRSRSTDINPYTAYSKRDVAAQATEGEGMSTYKGRIVHLSPDEMNSAKDYENHEDFYLSPYDFLDLVTGGHNKLNSYNVKKLIKDGKLPYGTFISDTATMENGFRNHSSMYTTANSKAKKLIGQAQSAKTGLTTGKADMIGYHPVEVSLEAPTRNEIINTRRNGFSTEFINLINSGESNLSGNYAKTAWLLYQLQELDPNSTLEQKKIDLSNSKNTYKIYDSHFSVQFDEEGQPKVVLSKNVPITGTLKELQKATNASVWNYSTFNAMNNDNVPQEYLDAKTLDNSINKTKYRKAKADTSKVLEAIYSSMTKDLFNEETGEIRTEFKPSDYNTKSDIAPARILEGGEQSVLEKSVWGRQGLREDTKLGAELTVALKNQSAGAAYFEQEPMMALHKFKQLATSQMSDSEIKDFAICQALFHGRDSETITEALKYHGYKAINEVASKLQNFKQLYPEVETAFQSHLSNLKRLNELVAKETGEPLGNCLMAEIAPYKSTNKEYNKIKAAASIKNALGLQRYNPAFESNKQSMTLEFDLWNSSEAIIKELSKMHSAKVIKDTLIDKGMLKNTTLLDNVSTLLDKCISETDDSGYIEQSKEMAQIQRQTMEVVRELTGISNVTGSNKISFKQYKDMYNNISKRLMILQDKFIESTGIEDVKSYTDFERIANDTSQPLEVKNSARAVANFYYAKMIVGQALIQSNTKFANEMGKYIQSLKDEGYSLVNAYGQKYIRGGVVNPLSSSSMANLVENMEISYNSNNETMWNQFVLEKIISGDIYLLRTDIADHIDSHVYTTKIPSNTMKTLKEISKWSSALQMALPSKILNRLISFTGFDYSMGIMYDPRVIKYMGPARRELLAAFQSKGTSMSDELKEYMIREGQPIGLTGKDPVTFSEDISGPEKIMKVLNTMTDPLEFQNHLGRYAIYLAAKESFESGNPNYGPAYFAKEAIDNLDTPEDKAMMVMDYILGSPGGFPELAKKTSGLMLYATFPMNFARTMGAYGMSIGKLFKEGYTADNASQWMKTAAVPSMGLAGITGLSMLITSWICDLFGVEEDEKEKMVKDLSTIDIVGTIIGGTPTKSGSSMNPLDSLYNMTLEPFTNTYNETALEKIFGFVNTNITSHLNPAIKVPIETLTGYDIYGSSLMNTKYQYTNIENGLRKVLGFFIGSNTANSIVDTYKMDKYSDESFLSSLLKGTQRGIASSLGNQKSYKKDITNYYNRLTDIRNYKYKTSDYSYSEDVEDYTVADSMERIRSTKSKYGSYNKEDYSRINNMLRKMIKAKEEPATVYSYIISEYNSGVSESTLRSALNNNSIIRKLESIDKNAYFSTLSSKEYSDLLRAITYEENFYPLLQEFFPSKGNTSTYLPNRTKYYNSGSGSSTSYIPYPKRYYPSFVYPSSSVYNNKYKSNYAKSNIDRVSVKVSPEMAVWSNDFNAIEDLDKKEWYLNNPLYNNLSDYEKRQRGGN